MKYAGAKKVADQIHAVEHGTMGGPERAYLISEVSMRLNRSDLTGALSVAYQSAKKLFPSASEFVLDTAAKEIVFKIGKGYTTRRNPRTRRRIGGTMETLPGEFADPGAARIEALRRIVANHQYEKIDGQMVDGFTASAIVQVYDALNETNRAKYRAMTVPKMASVAWKFVKNPAHRERVIARAGVSNKSYLSRPSQLSRTTPTKRLRSRRSVNLSAGREGFFPNPGGDKNAQRIALEKRIVRHAIRESAKSGWNIVAVDDGGEIVKTPTEQQAMDAIFSVDEARAIFSDGSKKVSVLFVPGNGIDVLADYTDIPDFSSAMERVHDLINRYESNPIPSGVRIVHNKLLGGRFDSKAQAEAHLLAQKARRDMPRTPAGLDDDHALIAGDYGRTKRNPTRKSRSLISLTGRHSGKVYGFAEESDLRLDNTGTLRRAALALANRHREPIRFERVSVTTLSPRMKENPAPRADRIAAASKRFTRFTGHRAANVRNLPFPENPGAALAVGPVLVLGYSATRDGKTENYLHKFTRYAAPLVAASHDGNSLYLLGGKYKFTERGIVDLKPR